MQYAGICRYMYVGPLGCDCGCAQVQGEAELVPSANAVCGANEGPSLEDSSHQLGGIINDD